MRKGRELADSCVEVDILFLSILAGFWYSHQVSFAEHVQLSICTRRLFARRVDTTYLSGKAVSLPLASERSVKNMFNFSITGKDRVRRYERL